MPRRPTPKKKPGNPPRRVPGREAKIYQKGAKWIFQFRRNDLEDIEFNTEAEAQDYEKYMKNVSIMLSPFKVTKRAV